MILMLMYSNDSINVTAINIQYFARSEGLHSAKGGAVETGCSDLYGVIHDFTI